MTGQMSLLDRPAPPVAANAVPLRDALHLVAAQWTRRLDQPVHVVELSNGGGYRLERQ